MAGGNLPFGLAPSGDMTSYTPTLSERATDFIRRKLFSDDRAGQQKASRVMDVAQFTPFGFATDMYDAGRAGGQGDYATAGTMMAMAMVPGPSLKHGSPQKGISKLTRSERGPLGPGVYTTPSESIAGRYAGEGGTVYSLPDKQFDVYTGAGYRDDAGYFAFKDDQKRLIAAAEPEKQAEVAALVERMGKLDGYPLYARLRQLYGGDEGAQALLKRAGFDGISGLVDGPETLLFNEQTVK
jgi:hypothetical protein